MNYRFSILHEGDTFEVSMHGNTIARVVKFIGSAEMRREIHFDQLSREVKALVQQYISNHELNEQQIINGLS